MSESRETSSNGNNDSDVSLNDGNGKSTTINNVSKVKFLLTNARSLSPKIESLQNNFTEHQLDFALITESWLSDGEVLNRDVIDLEYGTNLKILYKNRPRRPTNTRVVGGGVSIVYDKSKCSFRERKIGGNKFELVVAVGKIGRLERQVAVFCAYIKPKMLVGEMQQLNDMINAEILSIKSRSNPIIILGGDLNRRSFDDAVGDYQDIRRLNFDPTRGQACLDVAYSNASSISSEVWPPLENLAGAPSDHSCVVFTMTEERERDFVWTRCKYRLHTEEGLRRFGEDLDATNWDVICPAHLGAEELVRAFEAHIGNLTEKHFPMKTARRRSNEAPWITNGIRRLFKLKMRVFKRERKSPLWRRLRDELWAKLEESRSLFVDRIEESGSTKAYYTAVKALSSCEKPPEWSVQDLFPGATPEAAGDEVATYFTRISDQFEPLLPTSGAQPTRRPVTEEEVLKHIKKAKKPNSKVEGDMLPRLLKSHYGKIVKPVTRIFNSVFRETSWPERWKTETTVVIPKVANPDSLAECRNISCTAFLSKVLEGIILEDLRAEIESDPAQYGGIKNCSVDHMLVDLYDSILRPLEEGNPSVVLGIDFEKAFNRLNHKECLVQLRNLGASPTTLALVRSFLTGRSMRVKVGEVLSAPRKLQGGSPQGSILGCYLYCAATQHIGGNLLGEGPHTAVGSPPSPRHLPVGRDDAPADLDEGEGFGLVRLLAPDLDGSTSDTSGANSDDSFRTAEGSLNTSTDNSLGLAITTFKYVDDTTVVQTVDRGDAIRHISSGAPAELLSPEGLRTLLERIIVRAEEIGMKVNCAKTQMIVISADNGYTTTAMISIDGQLIHSSHPMKLLGFMIGQQGMHDQVHYIKDKFRRKFWSLIHLRRSGISGTRLFRLYTVMVRPVIETNSVVYHAMLTRSQAADLEKLQKSVLRLCYGHFTSYAHICDEREVPTLEQRRMTAVRRFTSKAINNGRFASRWFVRREDAGINLRNRRPFIENAARTNRYRNSPLLLLQRTANDIMTE